MPGKISLPSKNQLKSDLKNMTNVQVAEKYGIGLRLVSKWRTKLGLANIWQKEIVNKDDFIKDAKRMWTKDLMKKYNISRSTAKLWKQRLGLSVGKKVDKPITYIQLPNGCWACTSHEMNDKGYPSCKWERLVVIRLWVEKNGVWPRGVHCLHSCDNPTCVNPDHVRPGSQQENQKEMAERDRSPWGMRSGVRVLNSDEAKNIYGMKGLVSAIDVAEKYGISRTNVYYIWENKTWVRDVGGKENFPNKLWGGRK